MSINAKYLKSFINYVENFAQSHGLWGPNSSIIVSLSGGADSVALLWVMNELKKRGRILNLRAIHFNHGTRLENQEEEKFCQNFCNQLDIPLHIFPLNLSPNLSNFEKVARLKRREFLFGSCGKGELIVMGHHLDDSFEWHVMQSLRSSGLKSSLGIPIVSGPIRRPFLCVTKAQLLKFLNLGKIKFKEDPSNQDNRYDRNFIRNQIIPHYKKKYPKYLKHYVFRSNQLARTLGCHCQYQEESTPSHHLFEGQGGVGVIFKDKNWDQGGKAYSILEGLVKKVSKKGRGNLNVQIDKMIRSSKKGKFGPYNLSGEVLGYSFYQCFFFISEDQVDTFRHIDQKVASLIEEKTLTITVPVSLEEEKLAPGIIFPFLVFSHVGKTSDKNWPFKMKESLKRPHPLFPKTSEVCIHKGVWFHGLFWILEKIKEKKQNGLKKYFIFHLKENELN